MKTNTKYGNKLIRKLQAKFQQKMYNKKSWLDPDDYDFRYTSGVSC